MKKGSEARAAGEPLVLSLKRLAAGIPEGGRLRIAEAAARLGVSVRSLQRRLGDESLNYSQLVDLASRDIACTLLKENRIRIIDIGRRLGYRDPSSFSRAFLRWTGTTPRAYRAANKAAKLRAR